MPPDTISKKHVYATSSAPDSDRNREKEDTKIFTYCESNNNSLGVGAEHNASEHRDSHFVGNVEIPVSMIGPFKINEKVYRIPIATRDECLVYDMNRIAEALFVGGVSSRIVTRNMEAGSVVQFACEKQSGKALLSLNLGKNFEIMKSAYELASPCSVLCRLHGYTAGEFLYIRFTLQHTKTDDSMEIRNVTKGVQAVLGLMKQIFDDMKIVFCVGDLWCSQDKSCAPTATDASTHNHCKCKMTMESMMGVCVVAESVVSAELIRKTLKCSAKDLIRAQKLKNLMGKSYSGPTGAFNLQTSQILNAVLTAMGKNSMQAILGNSYYTSIKPYGLHGQDIHISCTLPSLTVDDQENPDCKSQTHFCNIISSIGLASQLSIVHALTKKL